jgi:hypothetical protein
MAVQICAINQLIVRFYTHFGFFDITAKNKNHSSVKCSSLHMVGRVRQTSHGRRCRSRFHVKGHNIHKGEQPKGGDVSA